MLIGEAYLHSRHEKRAIDLFGAFLVASMLGIPALAGAAAIRVVERQPAIFLNQRIGENWQYFDMLKLTTMQSDAHEHEQQWQDDDTDPRITRVGRFLRRFNLNEVPQVENIRRGNMHFIGARAVNEHVLDRLQDADAAIFDEWYPQYGLYKPALFGSGQLLEHQLVRQGNRQASSIQRMLGDISYWQHDASVIADLRIASELPRELIVQLCSEA
jgi:lipopolysaccharide/colanic/teichoic acid biosynthesis glycosyltransferase